jgi:ADP-ribosylglycohydrolase
MPSQTTVETRNVDGYHVVIEQHQNMSLPMGELNWLTPAMCISVYWPDTRGNSSPAAGQPSSLQAVLRQIFPLPAQKMSTAAKQQWIDDKLQRVLDALKIPPSQVGDQPDVLVPGIYSDGAAPYLYLLETARPRDGYTEALTFHARSGGSVYRPLINTTLLKTVRDLISQDWQRELHSYRPADGSRRTIEHIAGCLLGGAVGDALGAGIRHFSLAQIEAQFGPAGVVDYVPIAGTRGTLSWYSQMSLFTAEGLIRAKRRGDAKGICDVVGVVLHAYYRWLATQGETPPSPVPVPTEADGWLVSLAPLHTCRGPSQTVLAALRSGRRGTLTQQINHSKGAAAVARIAPVGLAGMGETFTLGAEIAALTHGHPTGYLAASCFAILLRQMMTGDSLATALDAANTELRRTPGHEECLNAVTRARELATSAPATPATVGQLGNGASATEALAIAVFCALKADDFAHGVRLAITHSGASDITGALTGQLLGALLGKQAIPQRWLDQLELRNEITELAKDFFLEFAGFPHASWFAAEWEKYPGW